MWNEYLHKIIFTSRSAAKNEYKKHAISLNEMHDFDITLYA